MKSNTNQAKDKNAVLQYLRPQRGLAFGVIIITALLAFELFNYSTTDFALTDLLGDLKFIGIRWATILSIAFCGIDFAGIARLFTPEEGGNEPNEIWYLFGAWLLARLAPCCNNECHAYMVGRFSSRHRTQYARQRSY